jgi:hypothetical protein
VHNLGMLSSSSEQNILLHQQKTAAAPSEAYYELQ